MAAISIQVPYPVFYDRDGQPLDNGNIYIGVANLDPVTNPLPVYYDEALTILASQPLVTSGGYVYRNGTPTQLYVNANDFSITVNDSNNLFVYSFPEATGIGVGAAAISFTGFKGQVGTVADLADADGSDWIGYQPAGLSSVARSAEDKMRDFVSVKDFGAVGDGVTDDTAAIHAAFDYIKNAFYGGGLIFPSGIYLTKSQIVFEEVYWKTFIFEGAMIAGGSESQSFDSVFKIVNAQNVKCVGSWTITAETAPFAAINDPNLYECGLFIDAQPGGPIEPVKGIVNFCEFSGLTVTRVKCGVRIASRDNDAQIAELAFNNLLTLFTPTGVHQGGSQAVIAYNNCTIASSVWPALTSPVYKAIIQDGGGMIISGGEIINGADINGLILDYRPAETNLFSNPYGTFVACGTVIENRSPFCVVSNPFGLSSPASANASISLVGCWGYSGDMDVNVPYLSVNDSSFEGKITFDEACNLYRNLGSAIRPGPAINCTSAPNAVVSLAPNAFRSGYPYWMSDVAGGQLIHGQQLAIQAFVNSGTSPIGAAPLIPTVRNTERRYDRYSSIYSLSTGIITIPAGLVDASLRIEASFITGSAGNVYLYDITNSRIMGYGQNDGAVANLVQTITTFTAGQQFAIYTNFVAPVTYGGSITNNINIYITTN
jgi:hypothetical protein